MVIDNQAEINATYLQVSNKTDLLYAFVTIYSKYIFQPRGYGTDGVYGMLTVHILTEIQDNPGITANELAKHWDKTKGAISQNIKVLERNGMITRKKDEKDAKIIHLFTTESGSKLALAHKVSDNNLMYKVTEELLQNCTVDELDHFYKVMREFIHVLEH